MRTKLLLYSLWFHLSLPQGRYSGSAAILKEEAIRETLLLTIASDNLFGRCLIDRRYPAGGGDEVGLHRSDSRAIFFG